MAQFETILVDTRKVACNGGGGALGHPRVYLRIKDDAREIECPYCSRLFINPAAAHGHGGEAHTETPA